ncbi:phosphoribosyltransferase family protein [Luteibaculum oceani]|uniref:phosphoribosyltransferase family protein n=1 Tax=Luteibaculum oceani TaxID=1294296 RepID=UPI0014777E2A|nr:phosphoribosyltransferase family protein [Luteibaculum oceani]
MNKSLILSPLKIKQKISRIAHQIVEFNYDEKEIYLVGIKQGGAILGELIYKEIKSITTIPVHLNLLSLDKSDPLNGKIELDAPVENLDNKTVILIDDVLESGRTLMYAAQFLLNRPLKKLSTTILVDRMHPKFPIRADFVGLTLSTTLQNHIQLEEENGELAVYLT